MYKGCVYMCKLLSLFGGSLDVSLSYFWLVWVDAGLWNVYMLCSKLLLASMWQRKQSLRRARLLTHCGLRTKNSSRKISESMQYCSNFVQCFEWFMHLLIMSWSDNLWVCVFDCSKATIHPGKSSNITVLHDVTLTSTKLTSMLPGVKMLWFQINQGPVYSVAFTF